jgi:uncharacterized membrane protein (UPF0136 family)
MSWLKAVLVLYSLLNIIGGVAGYISKQSVPSLISGTVAGVILLGATAYSSTNPRVGYIIAAVVTIGDLGFFAPKLMKGGGLWPAGVMVAASVVVLICLVAGHFMGKAASA